MVDEAKMQGDDLPTHFVVELITPEGPRYALCERTTIVEPGSESLPLSLIEELLQKNPLRAASIPPGAEGDEAGAHWVKLASAIQTGRDANA